MLRNNNYQPVQRLFSSVLSKFLSCCLSRKTLLFILFNVFILNIQAQWTPSDKGDDEARFATIAIPGVPSPNAASLGQYANYTVSNFTGTPPVNVPIYEIKQGNFKLPISLAYNSSGIKVGDVAGWVGLGWSLNCGGVITRNVRDIPDDNHFLDMGWLYYNYIVPANSWSSGRTVGYSPDGGQNNAVGLMEGRVVKMDTEPDIFYFNFNGHVGKFFFNQGKDTPDHTGQIAEDAHTINLIPHQDLKFSYKLANDGPRNSTRLGSFTVLDESGNTYYFEKSEFTVTKELGVTFPAPPIVLGSSGYSPLIDGRMEFKSSWYLTKVKTVQGSEVIFNYVPETYIQTLPDNYSVRNFPRTNPSGSSVDCTVKYNKANTAFSYSTNTITGLRLESIESTDFKVVFDADEKRKDLAGAAALTAVTVYAKDYLERLSFVKKVKLDYTYLQSIIDPKLDVDQANSTINGDPNKRLQLNHVTEMSEAGGALNPYTFEYNDTYVLPSRFSPHQDFWGYFNNNTCNTLTPTVYIYPAEYGDERLSLYQKADYAGTDEYIIQGADRTTNPAAAVSGTIKKITFPHGGSEEFTFGSNVFYYLDKNIFGGGLRLEKSVRYDGLDHKKDIIREYTYTKTSDAKKSSGVLFNLPVFTYTENFLPYWGKDPMQVMPTPYGEFDPQTFGYFTSNLVIASAPNFTLSGYDGINVGYSEITQHQTGNGYITSRYSTPGRALVNNDKNGVSCSPEEDGYCDGDFYAAPVKHYYLLSTCSDGSLDKGSVDTTGLQFTSNGYPFAPKTNYDWNRGLLLSQKYFSEDNKIVKEVSNEYIKYTPDNKPAHIIYGLKKGRMTNYKLYLSRCYTYYGLIRFDVVAQYPIMTNIAKVIGKTTTIDYSSVDNQNVQSITEYKYNGNQLQQSEIISTTGKNEKLNKHFVYPMDYKLNGSSISNTDNVSLGIVNLQNKHIVDPVIRSYTEVLDESSNNPKLISGKFIEYQKDTPFPKSLYEMELASPLSNYNSVLVNNNSVSIPEIYKSKVLFDYSNAGNMIQSNTESLVADTYIWGYNNQYVSASVKNSTKDMASYTSFEANDQGIFDWRYSGSTLPDGNAVTGKRIYSLAAGTIFRYGLDGTKSYIVSYFSKDGPQTVTNSTAVRTGQTIKGWTYYEHSVSSPDNLTLRVSGTGRIDELRLYPKEAQMITYTYEPLTGMTSSTDAKGKTTYYEYDDFKRLKYIKDQNGNIITKNTYHYKN